MQSKNLNELVLQSLDALKLLPVPLYKYFVLLQKSNYCLHESLANSLLLYIP